MDWITQLALCEDLGAEGTCTVADRRAVPLLASVLGPRCRETGARDVVLAWPDGTRMVLPPPAPGSARAADPAGRPKVRDRARALGEAMARGAVDGFDLALSLLEQAGQGQRLSFDGDGNAALGLDPLECLVPEAGETLLSLLPQRALALSARAPRRIRVPVIEAPEASVILRFTGTLPHGLPEVAAAGPDQMLEVVRGGSAGQPELRVRLSRARAPAVDLDLLGHRLALAEVRCVLGNPCRQAPAPPPDPLDRYGDPLEAYGAEAGR